MSSSTANAKVAMPETEAVNHLDCFNSQVSVATEDGNNNIDVELRMAEFPEDDPNLNPTPNTLEGRIARQQQKIEEIEGEITATQRELKRVKEKAFKYLGEEFIEEVLADSVYNSPESAEFRQKYLQNKILVIRSISELAYQLHQQNKQLQEMEQKMEQLNADKQNNTKQPFELFNMIQIVEHKLNIAEAEVIEAKEKSLVLKNELQIKAEESEALKNELRTKTDELFAMREEIVFLKLSLQNKTEESEALKTELADLKKQISFYTRYKSQIACNSNGMLANNSGGGYYSAVSTASLPADRETKWKVTIGSIGCYIMIAVVSNPHLDANRYNDPTICGWFNNGEVYGVRADNNQWNGFRANDVLHLSYNPNTAQLSLTKDNTVHTLSVTKNCEYYHYCIFSGIGTVTYEIL